MLRNGADDWGGLTKWFHWLMAALIFVQIPLGLLAVSWRLSPEEGQKRFETRSAVLFPPTPAYPEPPNGWASYTTRVNKPASEHVRAWTVLRPARVEAHNVTGPAPQPERTAAKLVAPNMVSDFQAGGR